jgi:hypothetical protein
MAVTAIAANQPAAHSAGKDNSPLTEMVHKCRVYEISQLGYMFYTRTQLNSSMHKNAIEGANSNRHCSSGKRQDEQCNDIYRIELQYLQ